MKKYRIIPHTADVRIFAEASNLPDLFTAAFLGMNEVLKKGFCKSIHQNLISRKIEITSYDATSLLVDFLSEVLTLSHINNVIFCEVQFIKIEPTHLSVKITGSKTDKFEKDIKAVSYHEAEIIKNKNDNYQTSIIFDI